MIPIDGPVRENVGLLGSPAFEIPRMVDRDRDMNASIDEDDAPRAPAPEERATTSSPRCSSSLSRWMSVFAALVLWTAALASYDRFGVFALFAATVAIDRRLHRVLRPARAREPALQAARAEDRLDLRPVFLVPRAALEAVGLADRAAVRRHAVPHHDAPRHGHEGRRARCSIAAARSPSARSPRSATTPTSTRAACCRRTRWRRACSSPTTSASATAARSAPAPSCTTASRMGDHVVLDADSFLMKGEVLESHTGWRGNPAKLARRSRCRLPRRKPPRTNTSRSPRSSGPRAPSIDAGGKADERRRRTQGRDGRQLARGCRPRAFPRSGRSCRKQRSNRSREARSDPGARPRVVYAGEDVVGFLMYDAGEPDESRAKP